jgi:hypothetical protein
MFDRIRCASLVLFLLSIGFVLSGILLITFSNSIIKKSVTKVELIFCNSDYYFDSTKGMSIKTRNSRL